MHLGGVTKMPVFERCAVCDDGDVEIAALLGKESIRGGLGIAAKGFKVVERLPYFRVRPIQSFLADAHDGVGTRDRGKRPVIGRPAGILERHEINAADSPPRPLDKHGKRIDEIALHVRRIRERSLDRTSQLRKVTDRHAVSPPGQHQRQHDVAGKLPAIAAEHENAPGRWQRLPHWRVENLHPAVDEGRQIPSVIGLQLTNGRPDGADERIETPARVATDEQRIQPADRGGLCGAPQAAWQRQFGRRHGYHGLRQAAA